MNEGVVTDQNKRMTASRRLVSESDDDQELSLDLWQGQFEFVGGYDPPTSPSPDDLGFDAPERRKMNGVVKSVVPWDDEEDDVEAAEQVQMLQQQMTVLADGHTGIDDRYTRAKQDSAVLQERVHTLEEQLREAEARAEERLNEEQRRNRENLQRCDRDKTAQIEACAVRLQAAEAETATLREECTRLRIAQDRLRVEKHAAIDRLEEAQAAARTAQEDREGERRQRDEATREALAARRMVESLSKEVERLRASNAIENGRPMNDESSDLTARMADMQNELTELLHRNKSLEESNEELQAQLISKSVQEGRHLLSGTSLAAELQAMTSDEPSDSASEQASVEQVRSALKEQQEVNAQLRAYIDGILLNIVENYPQLLEVKLK